MALGNNYNITLNANTTPANVAIDQFITRTQNKLTNLESRNVKIFNDVSVQAEVTKVQAMLDSLKMNPATMSSATKAINTELSSTQTAFNKVAGSVRQTQNATDDYFTTIGKDFVKFTTWINKIVPLRSNAY